MSRNASLVLTDFHNHGTEIFLSPKIGFELLKHIQGELNWSTEPNDAVFLHRIYVQFEHGDEEKDLQFDVPCFVYELSTYNGGIDKTFEKSFEYCADMRYDVLEAWADEIISGATRQ